jgi:hypothetical protein
LCNQNNESKSNEEHALFTFQFKRKCCSCGKIGHKAFQCKSKKDSNDRSNDGVSQPLFCAYCKQTGHLKTNCSKLIRRAEGNNGGSVRTGVADVVFNSMSEGSEFTENIWIGDSGASCYYCNSEEGLHNYTTISEEITVGNGNKMLAKKVGSLRCMVQQKNGETCVVVLKDVKFVSELWVNLFSISKALKNGFKIGMMELSSI